MSMYRPPSVLSMVVILENAGNSNRRNKVIIVFILYIATKNCKMAIVFVKQNICTFVIF